MAERLTPAQRRALEAVAAGRVRQTWSSGMFEKVEGSAASRRLNDDMMLRLKRLGLVEVAPREGYSFADRPVLITEAGRKCMGNGND